MTADNEDGVPEGLFKDVTFYIVGEITEHVIELLTKYGGKRDNYLSEMVSHVIADDVENSDYQEARELFELPCVMSEWVLYSVKCKKVLDKDLFAPEGRLFSGVIACASKLQEKDWLALWGMIVVNGGRCQGNFTNRCTHLITSATEGPKYEEALKHDDKTKVVTPDWVTDCVDSGDRVDELVYHPRLIVYPKPPSPPKPETPPLPEPMEVAQAPQNHPSNEETQTRPGTPGNASTKEALAKLVSHRMQDMPPGHAQRLPGHGSPHMGPMGQYPGHMGHHPGMRPGMHQSLPPGMQGFPPGQHPGQQLGQHPPGFGPNLGQGHPSHLHPPHQKGPTGGHLSPHKGGAAGGGQQKLRNITNNMDMHKQQASHAKQGQHKAGFQGGPRHPPPHYFPPIGFPGHQQTFPQYWGHDPADNVPPDVCLLGCIFYINDYPKIIGLQQLYVWKKVIEQHGGQVDPSYSNRVTHVLCASQKTDVFLLALRDQRRLVSAFWLNDVLLKKKLLPPWQALHLPLLYSEENCKPCNNQIICVTNFDGDDRTRVKQMIHALGAKYTGYMTRTNSALVCRRPEGIKYQKAKEWQIPVVNVQWLSDLILGHMDALRLPIQSRYLQVGQGDEFQMDVNKVQHLMVAWRTPLKVSKEIWKKFAVNAKKNALMPGQENLPSNPSSAKKQKLDTESVVDRSLPGPRVLFTGFPKGVTKSLQAMVVKLGGNVVENPLYCTHLVAQSFSRTMKFFVAINVCHHIVSKQWVEFSHQQNAFLSETMYMLQDPAGEEEMKCSLAKSLALARSQPLFAGLTFYVTPSVQPPVCDLKKVIESAGGTLSRKRRLAAKTIAALLDDQGNPTYIVITCADDIHLSDDLISKNIKVFTAEFILTGVMRQEKNYQQFQIDVQR